jgi:hypothetical protein
MGNCSNKQRVIIRLPDDKSNLSNNNKFDRLGTDIMGCILVFLNVKTIELLSTLNRSWWQLISDKRTCNMRKRIDISKLNQKRRKFGEIDLTQIVCKYHNITTLRLGNHPISDKDLLEISRNNKKLQVLQVGYYDFISKRSINFPPDRSDIAVIELVKNCPNIHTLEIDCWVITDETLIAISNYLPNITQLGISQCDVSDVGIIALVKKCHKITYLNLSMCTDITNESIIEVARNCPLLKELDIRCCNITDISIIELSKNCPKLETLEIGECTHVREYSIIELAKGCPNIKKLTHCTIMTDVGITALHKYWLQLEKLEDNTRRR